MSKNTLGSNGSPPYHAKLSFQIYDFRGSAGEQGTLEYWWAGTSGSYLEIRTPSLGTRHTLELDGLPDIKARRTVFLVSQLLDAFRSPGLALGPVATQISMEERVLGSTVLECMHREAPSNTPAVQSPEVCADPQTGTIRVVKSPTSVVLRNRTGEFGKKRVALDLSLSWEGIRAISGQVETLKSFNPAQEAVALDKSASAPTESSEAKGVGLAPSVVAGQKISGYQPIYPVEARQARISGTVLLGVEITEAGKVSNLFPIASPNVSLTNAAMQAVSAWTYKPYLLEGKPVRTNTIITVNFNLNVR